MPRMTHYPAKLGRVVCGRRAANLSVVAAPALGRRADPRDSDCLSGFLARSSADTCTQCHEAVFRRLLAALMKRENGVVVE